MTRFCTRPVRTERVRNLLLRINPELEEVPTRTRGRQKLVDATDEEIDVLLDAFFSKGNPGILHARRAIGAISTEEGAARLALRLAYVANSRSVRLLHAAIDKKPYFRHEFLVALADIVETSSDSRIRLKALGLLLDYSIQKKDRELAHDAGLVLSETSMHERTTFYMCMGNLKEELDQANRFRGSYVIGGCVYYLGVVFSTAHHTAGPVLAIVGSTLIALEYYSRSNIPLLEDRIRELRLLRYD